MSIAIPFDTLTYAQRLQDAGCDKRLAEEQARAQADIVAKQSEVLTHLVEKKLVTKKDLVHALARQEYSITLKLGGLMIVLIGIATALLSFLIRMPH